MITDYDSLVSTVNLYLDRNELSDHVKLLIQLFETEAQLDNRIRATVRDGSFDINAAEVDLPVDFKEVVSWSLNGSQYRDPLRSFGPELEARTDSTPGTPEGYLIVAGYGTNDATDIAKARFLPPPSTSFPSTLIYRQRITPLSSSNTSNWLLRRYPAIYLFGALAESAPYLREDNRVPLWMAKKEELITRLADFESRREFSGPTDIRHGLGGSEL